MGSHLLPVRNPILEGTCPKLQVWNLEENLQRASTVIPSSLRNITTAIYMDADALPIQSPEPLFDVRIGGQGFGVVATDNTKIWP